MRCAAWPAAEPIVDTGVMRSAESLFQRKVAGPLLTLLCTGATPRQLAWAMAAGIVVGINPLLGTTTIVALLLASLLRLNVVASQLACHLMYPLELLLFPVFLHLGGELFHSPPLPIAPRDMIGSLRHHPLETTRALWSWEWHALVVWGGVALVLTPVLQLALRPMLAKLHGRRSRPQLPRG